MWNCTLELLDIEGTVRVRQLLSLPLALGGLGLRSAVRSQTAAYWASWADSLPRIRERHPRIADLVGVALFRGRFPEGSNLQAAATCRERLVDVGFDAPEWEDVARGQRPGRSPENRDPTEPRFGWQCLASAYVERTFGPSFHRRIEPSSDPNVVHLLASRSLCTSGGRVALGTSDLPGSAPSSSLVPPPSLWGRSQSTSAWLISISFRQGGSTTGRLRLWQTDFLCSMARNSQWTKPWCLLSEGTGVLVASVLTTMEQLCSKHDARRKTLTLSWPAHEAAERVWWYLGCEIGGRWPMRLEIS